MSDCVVQMEMPKDCLMCPMAHWNKLDEITGCEVAPGKLFEFSRSKEYRESNTRPDWCPIICQLPEGHGRLVDENEVKDWVENWLCVNKYYHPYSSSKYIPVSEFYDVLQRMGEAVPAERSET